MENQPIPRPLTLEPYIIAYFGDLLLILEHQIEQVVINSLSSEEQSPDDR